jgi:hypothetical protein
VRELESRVTELERAQRATRAESRFAPLLSYLYRRPHITDPADPGRVLEANPAACACSATPQRSSGDLSFKHPRRVGPCGRRLMQQRKLAAMLAQR